MNNNIREVLIFLYDKASYVPSLQNGRRVKIWINSNPLNVTDIEFLFWDESVIIGGEYRRARIKILSVDFFDKLVNSGYRIFFGEINDNRFGELIPIPHL